MPIRYTRRYSFAISKIVEESLCCIVNWENLTSTCLCIYSLLDKACQRFGAGIRVSTGEIVHRGLRYELMPVSMMISAAVSFCLLMKGVELLILSPTRHSGVLLFHRAMSVRDGKARSRVILVFFGLDPAPPSFRHARPRVRRPSGLDSSVSGTVFKSVVPDLFRTSARQGKKGTFLLAVSENKRAEIDGVLVGKGNMF